MICEFCGKKSATSFCVVETNGNKTEKYLCNDCRTIVNSLQNSDNKKEKLENEKDDFCSFCGTTIKDFMQSSCVGCEICYDKFSSRVEEIIKNCQHGNIHIGKFPTRFIKQQKIKDLEQLLDKALNNQDLIQVNRLNKQLKELLGGEK